VEASLVASSNCLEKTHDLSQIIRLRSGTKIVKSDFGVEAHLLLSKQLLEAVSDASTPKSLFCTWDNHFSL